MWLAIGTILYYYVQVLIRLKEMQQIPPSVSLSIKQLVFYPIIVIMCWIPNTVFGILFGLHANAGVNSATYVGLGSLSVILPGLQGALCAIVFFVQNQYARNYLVLMLQCRISEARSMEGVSDRRTANSKAASFKNVLTVPLHRENDSSNWRSEMRLSCASDQERQMSDIELGYARDSNLSRQDPSLLFVCGECSCVRIICCEKNIAEANVVRCIVFEYSSLHSGTLQGWRGYRKTSRKAYRAWKHFTHATILNFKNSPHRRVEGKLESQKYFSSIILRFVGLLCRVEFLR